MKWALAACLLLVVVYRTNAQQSLGFNPNSQPGPLIKLEGISVEKIPEGYLVYSVPPNDIKDALEVVKFVEAPHTLFFAAEELLKKAQKDTPNSEQASVALGPCILSTNEIFFKKHKVLDRNVQAIGTFTCADQNGHMITLQVYSGGPTPH